MDYLFPKYTPMKIFKTLKHVAVFSPVACE